MNRQPHVSHIDGQEEYQRLLSLLDERRFDEAQVRARILLESGGLRPLMRAKIHNLVCWTFIEGLKYPAPEAVLHGEEAIRLFTEAGEGGLLVQAICNLASAYYQLGNYTAARSAYQELVRQLTECPSLLPCGLVIAYQGIAQLDLVEGRPRAALSRLDEARRLCQEDESRFQLADLLRRQAVAHLKLNQPDLAAETLAQIDETAFAAGPRSLWWKTHLCFTRARVELARGHWATARPMVLNTLALARELEDLPVLAECTCLLAQLEQAEGKREASRRARTALSHAIHSGRRDVVDDIRDRLRDLLRNDL